MSEQDHKYTGSTAMNSLTELCKVLEARGGLTDAIKVDIDNIRTALNQYYAVTDKLAGVHYSLQNFFTSD